MEVTENIDTMNVERLRALAEELRIVVTDNPNEQVLKARLKASIFG